jgi:hypothetical protein
MRVTKDGDVYRGSHIPGPTHNLLVMGIQPVPNVAFSVAVLPAVGACSREPLLEGDEAREWISVGIERANAELGTTYGAKSVEIVANDSRRPEVYAELARRIVHAAHEDFRAA